MRLPNIKPIFSVGGVALFLLLFLVACGGDTPLSTTGATTNEGEGGETTAVESPAIPPIPSGVLAEGVVEPIQFTNLSFQISGELVELLVSEGERVQAGDPLMRLKDTDTQLIVQQAEARLASQQAALESARIQLDLAQRAVNSAEAQVTAAEASLSLTVAGPRPEEIEAAEANLRAAESGITRAVGQRDQQLNIGTDAQINAAEAQVASAFAQVRALEEAYDSIIDGCFELPDGSEVCPGYGPVEEQTRAQLQAARLQLEAAQAQLDQLRSGATPAQQQAAQGGVGLALAQREIAQAQLDLLLAGATPEQIAQAEARVAQAEAGVEIARAGVIQAEAAVAQAEAAVVTTEAALASAQVAQARTTLFAPHDGIVTTIPVNLGAVIGTGQPVATLADLSDWLVRTTDLTELDVPAVSEGADVTISFDALPDEEVTGTVTRIGLLPGLALGDVVYEVEIALEDVSGLPLRWGMTAFVNVGE